MPRRYKVKAVILAAGSSSRMGRPKQLLEVKGDTMLDHAIAAALGATAAPPVVVLGAHANAIERKSRLIKRCEVVVNPAFKSGQASSLVTGVQRIINRCDAAAFLLCDQPFVTADLLRDLIGVFLDKKPDLLYPVYREQRGNPVIINSSLFPRLLSATGDQGARFLFSDSKLHIIAHEVDDSSVAIDIDTPEAYLAVK